jgi:methionine sulfoxide reductase heme-binding subunit
MAHAYQLVSWNRQKRIYDILLGAGILVFFSIFTGLQVSLHPDITLETLFIRSTAVLAFLMLHIILCIGPLARLDKRFIPLLYNRRHFGVTMSLVALTHAVFSLVQFHALGNVDPLRSLFISNPHYASIGLFPFEVLGFFALIILLIMASTSHDFWLKNLSPRIWKSLHMLVYLAYFLLVGHVMLGIIQLEQSPGLMGLLGLGVITVTSLHLAAAYKRRNQELPAMDVPESFTKVCRLEDIAENRAKTILIGKENIAVFKYDGKLSAVNNMCRHQNGPLGEGKILDGCITCPWHGYQYLPHNGQSPPPFTEKLETYDVKLKDGWVYVNPRPYPEGTEVKPCLINI